MELMGPNKKPLILLVSTEIDIKINSDRFKIFVYTIFS